MLILSAAPAIGQVPGSAQFASRYQAKYGPIANYAVNSYDSARLVLLAIETAAKAEERSAHARRGAGGAAGGGSFQGVAYARPVTWDAKGDNRAAVIFLNVVEGDRFKEIGQVSREELGN